MPRLSPNTCLLRKASHELWCQMTPRVQNGEVAKIVSLCTFWACFVVDSAGAAFYDGGPIGV